MINIQFTYTRHVTRISSNEEMPTRLWPKAPPTKNRKSSDLVQDFWRRDQFILFRSGGLGPRAPHPHPSGYAPERRPGAQPGIAQNLVGTATILAYLFNTTQSPTAMLIVS